MKCNCCHKAYVGKNSSVTAQCPRCKAINDGDTYYFPDILQALAYIKDDIGFDCLAQNNVVCTLVPMLQRYTRWQESFISTISAAPNIFDMVFGTNEKSGINDAITYLVSSGVDSTHACSVIEVALRLKMPITKRSSNVRELSDDFAYSLSDFYSLTDDELSGLTSVKLVEGAEYAPFFSRCPRLMHISIPKSVKEIFSYAFQGCTELRSVELLCGNANIGIDIFDGCNKLNEVTVPSDTRAYAYMNEHYSTIVRKISDANTESKPTLYRDVVTYAEYMSMSDNEKDFVTEITIPSTQTVINNFAFMARRSLAKVTILGNITEIGTCAFAGCKSLREIALPESLEIICAGAFSDCTGLTTLRVPQNVVFIGINAFSGCTSLKHVIFYSSKTLFEHHDNAGIFDRCTSLESITVIPTNSVLFTYMNRNYGSVLTRVVAQ